MEVTVQQKVSWLHEHVLGGGGQTRQRLTYDQITMTQFVQGFATGQLTLYWPEVINTRCCII